MEYKHLRWRIPLVVFEVQLWRSQHCVAQEPQCDNEPGTVGMSADSSVPNVWRHDGFTCNIYNSPHFGGRKAACIAVTVVELC